MLQKQNKSPLKHLLTHTTITQHPLRLQETKARKHKQAEIALKAAVPHKEKEKEKKQMKSKIPRKQLQALWSISSIKREMFNRLRAAVISLRPQVPEQRYHDLSSHT